MSNQIEDIISKLTSPGDVAAALLGFSAGFAADTFLIHIGVPPGTFGALGASTVLGLKKAADATLKNTMLDREERRKEQDHLRELDFERERELYKSSGQAQEKKRKEIERQKQFEKLPQQVVEFRALLVTEEQKELLTRLDRYTSSWKKDIIDNEQFNNVFRQMVNMFLEPDTSRTSLHISTHSIELDDE